MPETFEFMVDLEDGWRLVVMISLTVNKRSVKVDVEPSTPLLWVLREHLGLTGTKYGGDPKYRRSKQRPAASKKNG